jgi:hypothetical protein
LKRCQLVPESAVECSFQHPLVGARDAGWTCRDVAAKRDTDVVQLEGEGGVILWKVAEDITK